MPTKLSSAEMSGRLASLPRWSAPGTDSIERQFKFGDHITAMGFAVRVAMIAEVLDHHPEMRIVYNTVDIVLTTHSAGGVTAKDFELAGKIDALA